MPWEALPQLLLHGVDSLAGMQRNGCVQSMNGKPLRLDRSWDRAGLGGGV